MKCQGDGNVRGWSYIKSWVASIFNQRYYRFQPCISIHFNLSKTERLTANSQSGNPGAPVTGGIVPGGYSVTAGVNTAEPADEVVDAPTAAEAERVDDFGAVVMAAAVEEEEARAARLRRGFSA